MNLQILKSKLKKYIYGFIIFILAIMSFFIIKHYQKFVTIRYSQLNGNLMNIREQFRDETYDFYKYRKNFRKFLFTNKYYYSVRYNKLMKKFYKNKQSFFKRFIELDIQELKKSK